MIDPAFAFAVSLGLAVATFVVTVHVAATGADTLAIAGLGVAGAVALAGVLMAHAEMIREEEGELGR